MKATENRSQEASPLWRLRRPAPEISASVSSSLQHGLPDWSRVWNACKRRTHAWQVPPRWSPRDWWEEIDAECLVAACHSLRIFDPTRGPSLASFVYHQILAAALARYRQEWIYARRNGLSATTVEHAAEPNAVEDRFAAEQEEKRLLGLLTDLPESDRRLIHWLFYDGRSETDVASGLGISQQAVSKRKLKILRSLRNRLSSSGQP